MFTGIGTSRIVLDLEHTLQTKICGFGLEKSTNTLALALKVHVALKHGVLCGQLGWPWLTQQFGQSHDDLEKRINILFSKQKHSQHHL